MKIDDFLCKDAFTMVNKKLAKTIGIGQAMLLSEMLYQRKKADNEVFEFSWTEMEDELGVSPKTQQRYINELKELGLISVEKGGLHNKNFFRINDNAVLSVFPNGKSTPVKMTTVQKSKGPDSSYIYKKTYKKKSSQKLEEQETHDNIKEKKEKVPPKERKEIDYCEEFEKLWEIYPRWKGRGSKPKSYRKWLSRTEEERQKILDKAKEKRISCECGIDDIQFSKAFEGYMENERGVDFDLESFVYQLMGNKKDKDSVGIKLAKEYWGEENVRRFIKKYIMTHDSMVLDLH